ncbi:hypothetical protein FB446DRAFT_472999 [Lentinula raphanica]|nr:hypothetical protein FB446DRAFT_472999 [Lentinula raphanica]
MMEKQKKEFLANFKPKVPIAHAKNEDIQVGHLYDPEGHYVHLASQYDLSKIRIPLRDWIDNTNVRVHMRHVGVVFKAPRKVYLKLKVHMYNIVQGSGGQPVPRPSRIASAIIHKMVLLPDDEDDLRVFFMNTAQAAKDDEDRKLKLQQQAEADRERMLDSERKRLAEEDAMTAAAAECKKRKLEEAHLAFGPSSSTSGSTASNVTTDVVPDTINVLDGSPTTLASDPTPHHITTGGKAPKKVGDKSKPKPKSARAMGKQRAIDDNKGDDTDVEMDPVMD